MDISGQLDLPNNKEFPRHVIIVGSSIISPESPRYGIINPIVQIFQLIRVVLSLASDGEQG